MLAWQKDQTLQKEPKAPQRAPFESPTAASDAARSSEGAAGRLGHRQALRRAKKHPRKQREKDARIEDRLVRYPTSSSSPQHQRHRKARVHRAELNKGNMPVSATLSKRPQTRNCLRHYMQGSIVK